jgi:hypothetical protein
MRKRGKVNGASWKIGGHGQARTLERQMLSIRVRVVERPEMNFRNLLRMKSVEGEQESQYFKKISRANEMRRRKFIIKTMVLMNLRRRSMAQQLRFLKEGCIRMNLRTLKGVTFRKGGVKVKDQALLTPHVFGSAISLIESEIDKVSF